MRNLEEIKQEITDKALSYQELSELEANRSVAQAWDYAKSVMAFGILQLEKSQDLIRQEIKEIVDFEELGGVEWYRKKVLEYQHGDSLKVVNNRPVYSAEDLSKRLVKHVAIIENQTDGSLTVKVAGKDLTQLPFDVVVGLKSYLQRVKIAGTLINAVSLPADQIAYTIVAQVDKFVINSAGEAIEGSDTPFYDAIDEFHKNIDFNGTLYLSRVTDVLQEIKGVVDVEIQEARFLDGSWITINRKYDSNAGYVTLDRDNSNITIV